MEPAAVPAVDAATVILVRENPAGELPWQLFMVRRPVRSEFAADVYVFPGGKVDPADRDPDLQALFDTPLPSDAPDGPAFRAAAIRELFEEAGVLLALDSGPTARRSDRRYDDGRRQLRAGKACLIDIAGAERLSLHASALRPFAHWITPQSMPRRYNTWFYVARLPAGQEADHDEVETVDGLWLTPYEALRQAQLGQFPLVFVTERLLQRMTRHPSIDELLESVSDQDVQPIMPKPVDREDGTVFLVPGDPGY